MPAPGCPVRPHGTAIPAMGRIRIVGRDQALDASYPPAAMARACLMFGCILFACACAPAIGDACETGLDCSAQSTRLCDLTQQGGYCTLPNCERDTCPEEAVCVQFRPNTQRLSSSFCMLECDSDSDCRTEHGYRCVHQNEFGVPGAGEAQVLDGEDKRFCGQTTTLMQVDPEASSTHPEDGGVPLPDSGVDGGS